MENTFFSVSNFGIRIKCKDCKIGEIWSNCNPFSYDFAPGVYALTGEINGGGWAFAYALTGEDKAQQLDEETRFYLQGEEISLSHLSKYVQNLSFGHSKKWSDRIYKNTVCQCVEHGIKKNNLDITSKEIQNLFRIDQQRFERNVRFVGIEEQKCNAAIGLANGKKIFCFPYLTRRNYIPPFVQNICEVLKSFGCIVLIPIHDVTFLESSYDYEINIQQLFEQSVSEDGYIM